LIELMMQNDCVLLKADGNAAKAPQPCPGQALQQISCNAVTAPCVIISNDLDLDVADCLARVRGQDQDAARSLVEYLYPMVIRIVRANLPRRAAEEDLAQDIFVKMFQKLDQFRGDVPFDHWVSRIAVNHCLNAIRAQKNRPEWRMADLSE